MRESPKESKTLNAVFLLLTSLMRCLFAIHNQLKNMCEILAMHCAICTMYATSMRWWVLPYMNMSRWEVSEGQYEIAIIALQWKKYQQLHAMFDT